MKTYIDSLKNHIAKHSLNDNSSDAQTLMEMLYCFCTRSNAIDSDKIRKGFAEVESLTQHLPLKESDAICTAIISRCAEEERAAFLTGLRVGAQLVLELTGQ